MSGPICHSKDLDEEFTDEQLVQHLITSTCSECADAGFRLKQVLEENAALKAAQLVVSVQRNAELAVQDLADQIRDRNRKHA